MSLSCPTSEIEKFSGVWKIHDKGRAAALAAAFGSHCSAVAFDDVTDDRKSDAEAAAHAGNETAGLPELFEHCVAEILC